MVPVYADTPLASAIVGSFDPTGPQPTWGNVQRMEREYQLGLGQPMAYWKTYQDQLAKVQGGKLVMNLENVADANGRLDNVQVDELEQLADFMRSAQQKPVDLYWYGQPLAADWTTEAGQQKTLASYQALVDIGVTKHLQGMAVGCYFTKGRDLLQFVASYEKLLAWANDLNLPNLPLLYFWWRYIPAPDNASNDMLTIAEWWAHLLWGRQMVQQKKAGGIVIFMNLASTAPDKYVPVTHDPFIAAANEIAAM